MKFAILILFATGLFANAAFAAYTSQCDIEYEQCMRNCCSKCNSTLGMDSAESPVCWVWATKSLDAKCMRACKYCNDEYQDCNGLPHISEGEWIPPQQQGGSTSVNTSGGWVVSGQNKSQSDAQKQDDLSRFCASSAVLAGVLFAFARRSD